MSRIANEQVNHSSTRWPNLADVVQRIEAEYREMPGLSVTEAQARRLWGLDEATCRRALDTLLRRGILRRTRRESYVRAENIHRAFDLADARWRAAPAPLIDVVLIVKVRGQLKKSRIMSGWWRDAAHRAPTRAGRSS